MATRLEKLRVLRQSQDPALAVLSHIQMVKGEKGDKGDKGDVGPAGARGDRGFQGARGADGVGIMGERGPAGRDGTNGKDGKDGKDGVSPSIKAIVAELKKLPIAYKDLKDAPDLTDLPKLITFLKSGGFRGGGDTVAAGSGVTISVSNGVKTISTAAGTQVYDEVVAGNTNTFTLAHVPTAGTVRVYGLGQRLVPTTDWTIVGAVITTVGTWATGNIVADYSY